MNNLRMEIGKRAALVALTVSLSGCGLFGWLDREDEYQKSQPAKPLEVPPDLSEPVDDPSMSVPRTPEAGEGAGQRTEEPPDLDNTVIPSVEIADLPRDSDGTPYLRLSDTVASTWRRTGLALERAGFTIEERDEARRLYTIRYAPPSEGDDEDGGFFSWLFGGDDEDEDTGSSEYRVSVVGDGVDGARVTILDAAGNPQNTESAQRILSLLADRLS